MIAGLNASVSVWPPSTQGGHRLVEAAALVGSL